MADELSFLPDIVAGPRTSTSTRTGLFSATISGAQGLNDLATVATGDLATGCF